MLLIGSGVSLAVLTGLLGYRGGDFLEPVLTYLFGIKWVSSMLFDLGVFLGVLGLIMVAFNVLGAGGAQKAAHVGGARIVGSGGRRGEPVPTDTPPRKDVGS